MNNPLEELREMNLQDPYTKLQLIKNEFDELLTTNYNGATTVLRPLRPKNMERSRKWNLKQKSEAKPYHTGSRSSDKFASYISETIAFIWEITTKDRSRVDYNDSSSHPFWNHDYEKRYFELENNFYNRENVRQNQTSQWDDGLKVY
uniref:Uncharacterized protein n=1 Tax=Acrobeloides nanus TaxID=290746 RepID=A0A914DV75_9BILA